MHSSKRNDFLFGELLFKTVRQLRCVGAANHKKSIGKPRPSLGMIRSLATKASKGDGFPEIRHCILSGFVRIMSDNVAKQLKGFERKLPSWRRVDLSLARADIVRHKSGIFVIAGFDNVRLRRDAKKSKQRRRTTVYASHYVGLNIVLGSALKSSRKKSPDFVS